MVTHRGFLLYTQRDGYFSIPDAGKDPKWMSRNPFSKAPVPKVRKTRFIARLSVPWAARKTFQCNKPPRRDDTEKKIITRSWDEKSPGGRINELFESFFSGDFSIAKNVEYLEDTPRKKPSKTICSFVPPSPFLNFGKVFLCPFSRSIQPR